MCVCVWKTISTPSSAVIIYTSSHLSDDDDDDDNENYNNDNCINGIIMIRMTEHITLNTNALP